MPQNKEQSDISASWSTRKTITTRGGYFGKSLSRLISIKVSIAHDFGAIKLLDTAITTDYIAEFAQWLRRFKNAQFA